MIAMSCYIYPSNKFLLAHNLLYFFFPMLQISLSFRFMGALSPLLFFCPFCPINSHSFSCVAPGDAHVLRHTPSTNIQGIFFPFGVFLSCILFLFGPQSTTSHLQCLHHSFYSSSQRSYLSSSYLLTNSIQIFLNSKFPLFTRKVFTSFSFRNRSVDWPVQDMRLQIKLLTFFVDL